MPTLGLGAGLSPTRKKLFSPIHISGLKLWLDPSDVSSISATGSLVDVITDKSGFGNNADSSTTGRPATGTRTINGLNALDWNQDWLRIYDDADFDHNANGFTAIVVAQFDNANSSNFEPVFCKSGASNREWSIGNLNGTNGQYGNYYETGVTSEVLSRSNLTDTNPHIYFMRYSGAASDVEFGYDRAVDQVTSNGAQTIQQSTNNLWLGWFGTGSSYFDGLTGEVLYFNRALNDAELDKLGKYLSNKWGAVWTKKSDTLILTNEGQSNATNGFHVGTLYSQAYNAHGKNALLTTAANYFDDVEFLNNADSGKPVMQVSSDGNHWVNSDLTDGPYLTQWKSQLAGYFENYGTFGDASKSYASIWLGSEGDTGQDEDDFYDALHYMFTAMRDFTNAEHKIFVVVPGIFGSSGFDSHQNQRNAILRIIDDLDFVYFGAEAYDIPIADIQHYSPAGQATLHTRLANRVAAVLGKRSTIGTLGPIITSASYSGSTVTAGVLLDGASAISGSEVDGFRIEDDGSPVTISSIVISGTTITFNLASPIAAGSVVNLWCNYGRGANVTQSNLVKDLNGLPLRSIAGMAVTEA